MKIRYILMTALSAMALNACSERVTEDKSNEVKETYFAEEVLDQVEEEDRLQNVRIPPIPDSLTFAGERVPLEYPDVRESLMLELSLLTYGHGGMIRTMNLVSRYEDMVKKILREEGVPEDLFYLAVAESGLRPVTSPAKAAGYWQFIKPTAKRYGLKIEKDVDERYDWDKATRAAATYLKECYDEFGTWALAAASYNIGEKNIRERIEYQSLNNYYDMQFPEETGRYVFRIMAYKIILENPEVYGFHLDRSMLCAPEQWKEVMVTGPVENWSVFAAEHGTTFKFLKRYNQWMRLNGMKNREKDTFMVRVPLGRN